jgi:hypothetical protein
MNTRRDIRKHPSLCTQPVIDEYILLTGLVVVWTTEGVLWKLLRQRSFAIEFGNRSDIFLISP